MGLLHLLSIFNRQRIFGTIIIKKMYDTKLSEYKPVSLFFVEILHLKFIISWLYYIPFYDIDGVLNICRCGVFGTPIPNLYLAIKICYQYRLVYILRQISLLFSTLIIQLYYGSLDSH